MKQKSVFLFGFYFLTASFMIGQNNCSLITNVTISVPESTQQVMQGQVLRMLNSTFTAVNLNEWSHIAWVKTTTNGGKIYKNGTLVFSGDFQDVAYSWGRLDLGAEFYTSYGNYFKGFIDEVRISNIERTAEDFLSHYSSGEPFITDDNTIGLWHFDDEAGTIANAQVGPNAEITNGLWTEGRFGSCVYYNGLNTVTSANLEIPTSNVTVEFWIKPSDFPVVPADFRPVSLYGVNTTSFILSSVNETVNYTWSTGDLGSSISIDPSTQDFVWVTNGSCNDTIWFNSQASTIIDTVINYIDVYDTLYTNINLYDTTTTYITVTDTLIINLNPTGFNPVTYANTILMYPNPSSEQLTINYGDFASLAGYTLKIFNSIGQEIHSANINQQQEVLPLNTWGGAGTYQVVIFNAQGVPVDTRTIVLQ